MIASESASALSVGTGLAAKMWCLWSKQSVFEVGEAVSVKRSDGRYTLGVVVGAKYLRERERERMRDVRSRHDLA